MKSQKMKLITSIFLSTSIFLNSGIATTFAMGNEEQAVRHAIEDEEVWNGLEEGKYEAVPKIAGDIDTVTSDIISIIVEFDKDPLAISGQAGTYRNNAEENLQSQHESFKQELLKEVSGNERAIIGGMEFKEEFFFAFNGMVIDLPGNLVETVSEVSGVKRIWKNGEVQLPEVIEENEASKSIIMDSFPSIGVDRLHDEGATGKGIKVGVLDTGIDYNHPDLKDVYVGGYDFVNNDNDPMETTYDEWKAVSNDFLEILNGSTYYTSHGTHVAGTIAAGAKNDSNVKAIGVAPEVELHAYKVLGNYGRGNDAWIIGGIDKAVKDGMDIINLSLGSNSNNSLTPTTIAVNNAALAGVIPVVAAGNSGPNDLTLGSPGTSPLAITVGASNTEVTIPTFTGTVLEKGMDIKMFANNYEYKVDELQGKEYEFVDCGLGKPSDFEGKDLTGKIALIRRGDLAFVDKIANAKAAGTELVFVYNNEDGYINSYLDTAFEFIPTFNLTKEDGEQLLSGIEENNKFVFGDMSSEIQQGDILADFSSKGPVANTSEIKPDLVAPGVNILSTYPEFINHKEEGEDYSTAYSKISGTSMATPHVAGIVALMLSEAKEDGKDLSLEEVKTILMNTSDELNGDYSVYEKGAGRVNAYDAVRESIIFEVTNSTVIIEDNSPTKVDTVSGALQFGAVYYDGEAVTDNRVIKITNSSNEARSFKLSVKNSKAEGLINDSVVNNVKLNIPESVEVPANGSIEVPVELILPVSAQYGFYEGMVTFTDVKAENSDYVIPYGVRYDERGMKVFEMHRYAINTNYDSFAPAFDPRTGFDFAVSSPMVKADLYLKNAETGERIGYVRSYDMAAAVPGVTFRALNAFNGNYQPMVGDYIENRLLIAGEGHYKLEFETVDIDGNVYLVEEDLFIDNTPPEVTYDRAPDIYEIAPEDYTVEDGIEAFYVKGKIYDDTIEKLNNLGHNYDVYGREINQGLNWLYYAECKPNEWNGFAGSTIKVEADGSFKFGVAPQEIAATPLELRLYPYDYATATIAETAVEHMYEFMEEGTAFGTISCETPEETVIKEGDTPIFNVNVMNMNNTNKIYFELFNESKEFGIEGLTLNNEFKKYVEATGQKTNFTYTREEGFFGFADEVYKVTIEIVGDKGIDIGELTKVMDVKTRAKLPHSERVTFKMRIQTNYENCYTTTDGVENQVYIVPFKPSRVSPSNSDVIIRFVAGEGFYDEQGWSKKLPYDKFDIKPYVIHPDGNRYDGIVLENGKCEIKVPASLEEGMLCLEVPGHFKNWIPVQLALDVYDGALGSYTIAKLLTAYAGDIDGNDIIDASDLELVTADLGKTTDGDEYLVTDLNKDKVVDEKDIAYVNKNMGLVNPRLIEDTEKAIAGAGVAKTIEAVEAAMEKVNLLPESNIKVELLAKVVAMAEPMYIARATEAVVIAEETMAQGDVDTAKALVEALSDSEAKNELIERLNAVQEAINNAIALENAIKAVEKAEDSKAQADVDVAKTLVEALTESETKNELLERLNSVQEAINNATALENATKAVEKAEEFMTQGDVDAAMTLVEALVDSEAKTELLARLNAVQEVIDNATALENATRAVEKAEATKVQGDVDAAKALVDTLEDSKAKKELIERLDEVQAAIDNATALENATKAVEKAEATKAQVDVDSARELVKALKDSEAKKALTERLNKVQGDIDLAIAIKEATKAVEKAEKTKNKEDIKAAEKLVKKLPDCQAKTDLLARLKKLSQSLPQTGGAMGAAGMLALGGVTCVAGASMLKKKKK